MRVGSVESRWWEGGSRVVCGEDGFCADPRRQIEQMEYDRT